MGCIMIYSIRGRSHWENAHNFKNIYIERWDTTLFGIHFLGDHDYHLGNDGCYPCFLGREGLSWWRSFMNSICTNISHKGSGPHCSHIMPFRCQFFLQLSVDIHFADSSLLWIFLSPFHLLLNLSRNISFSAQLPEDCSKFYILEVM